MKISGQINGVNVDLGERPEPVEDGGQWWEAVEYRKPLPGENVYDLEEIHLIKSCSNRCREWIMHPVPRPTPSQLKAIGMRERDQRPVECRVGDTIWQDGMAIHITVAHYPHIGKHRWVLEDVPAEKNNKTCEFCTGENCPGKNVTWRDCESFTSAAVEPARTECEGCEKQQPLGTPLTCWYSCVTEPGIRRNWIPAKAPAPVTGVGAMEQSLLDTISECCDKLGRSRHQTITEFIYALAEKARQSPTPAPTRGLTGEGE